MYSLYAKYLFLMLRESLFYLQFLGMSENSVLYTINMLQYFIEVSRRSSRIFPHVTDRALC